MTSFVLSLFWIGVLIILYTYVGYGIIIFIISKIRKHASQEKLRDKDLPEVTLVIAAYNVEAFIENKIINTLSLD